MVQTLTETLSPTSVDTTADPAFTAPAANVPELNADPNRLTLAVNGHAYAVQRYVGLDAAAGAGLNIQTVDAPLSDAEQLASPAGRLHLAATWAEDIAPENLVFFHVPGGVFMDAQDGARLPLSQQTSSEAAQDNPMLLVGERFGDTTLIHGMLDVESGLVMPLADISNATEFPLETEINRQWTDQGIQVADVTARDIVPDMPQIAMENDEPSPEQAEVLARLLEQSPEQVQAAEQTQQPAQAEGASQDTGQQPANASPQQQRRGLLQGLRQATQGISSLLGDLRDATDYTTVLRDVAVLKHVFQGKNLSLAGVLHACDCFDRLAGKWDDLQQTLEQSGAKEAPNLREALGRAAEFRRAEAQRQRTLRTARTAEENRDGPDQRLSTTPAGQTEQPATTNTIQEAQQQQARQRLIVGGETVTAVEGPDSNKSFVQGLRERDAQHRESGKNDRAANIAGAGSNNTGGSA